jgi:hypothetical protein
VAAAHARRWMALQAGVLLSQHFKGPRWFVPARVRDQLEWGGLTGVDAAAAVSVSKAAARGFGARGRGVRHLHGADCRRGGCGDAMRAHVPLGLFGAVDGREVGVSDVQAKHPCHVELLNHVCVTINIKTNRKLLGIAMSLCVSVTGAVRCPLLNP